MSTQTTSTRTSFRREPSMRNRRRFNHTFSELQLPISMSDVVYCLLLTLLAAQPEFPGSIRLPTIRTGNGQRAKTSLENPIRVVLSRDGQVTCEDQATELDELPRRLSDPNFGSRSIDLLIDGQGPTEQFLRLQLALQEADLLPRVHLRFNIENSAASQPASSDSTTAPSAKPTSVLKGISS